MRWTALTATLAAFVAMPGGSIAAEGAAYVFRAKPMVAAPSSSPAPLLATAGAASGEVGSAVPVLSAAGGTAPYAWRGSGLPSGIAIGADGSVTAATAGRYESLVAVVTDAKGVEASVTFSFAASGPTGGLLGFGYNGLSLVKAGTTENQPLPSRVLGDERGWTAVAAFGQGACAIRNGDLLCWGDNAYGQLGTNGKVAIADGPRLVSAGGWTVVSGSPGGLHACGIRNGVAHCWGRNTSGQLGTGGTAEVVDGPRAIDGGSRGWTSISAGGSHSCGVRDGRLLCWGDNWAGQLGTNGRQSITSGPALVGTSDAWTKVSAGDGFTCGLKGTELMCWGTNSNGRLGMGQVNHSVSIIPEYGRVAGAWTDISLGSGHACAIMNTPRGGEAHCWGSNRSGQVGNGSTEDTGYRLAVSSNQGDWTAVSAGANHSCGIRSGQLVCWGGNEAGQLGRESPASPASPGAVEGGSGEWKAVAAGGSFTLALR